jgi:hypothetical protein
MAGGDGNRFVVRADEKLAAFLEFESAIRLCGELSCQAGGSFSNSTVVTRIRIPLGSLP